MHEPRRTGAGEHGSSGRGQVGNASSLAARVLVVALALGTLSLTVVPSLGGDSRPIAVVDGRDVGFALAYVPLWERTIDLDRDLDLVRESGARWIRFDFYWAALEPVRGHYEWSLADRVVDAASQRGLEVLGTLAYSPEWARPPGTTDKHPPVDVADFAAFAAAAARRYGPRGVHAWEIWNEPNAAFFWAPHPDPRAYGALLRAASAALRRVDPEVTVVSGGLAPVGPTQDYVSPDGLGMSPWRFLAELYAAGAGDGFDALGHHPYPPLPRPPGAAIPGNPFAQTAALHALMHANGDGAKRIWATESGAFTGGAPGSVSESRQRAYALDLLVRWDRWSFTGPFFYYSLRDVGTDPDDREDNFGLLRHDFEPKEAWRAFGLAVDDPDRRIE